MITFDPHKHYQEYLEYFKGMTDEQLVHVFNREVGNNGWVSARASYLGALHGEFENRNYNYSAIDNKKELSFAKKIKLFSKNLIVIGEK